MDDLTSREDEKTMERAREQGRREEIERERERERAMEQGKKMGKEEEQKRQKQRGGGSGLKLLLLLILLIVIIAVIAIVSLSVTVTNIAPGGPLPFMTMYGVSFPEGQPISVGNTQVTVLSYENELISDIDGDRQKLVIGEQRVIEQRRATISTLGSVRLMETDFLMNLTYKGERDNRAYFDMAVYTSQQVPDMLLRLLLPDAIDARPI
ncbi:MAG TPA: hypothetical protein PLO06_08310 [Methanoregulaceae archaeon]|nr:hypothetical protein [Methanoregulaceae archaeon]